MGELEPEVETTEARNVEEEEGQALFLVKKIMNTMVLMVKQN